MGRKEMVIAGAAVVGGIFAYWAGSKMSNFYKSFPDAAATQEVWKATAQNWTAVNAHAGTLQELRKLYDACPINSRSVFFQQKEALALLKQMPESQHAFCQQIVRDWSSSWMGWGKAVAWPDGQRRASHVMSLSAKAREEYLAPGLVTAGALRTLGLLGALIGVLSAIPTEQKKGPKLTLIKRSKLNLIDVTSIDSDETDSDENTD
ncbi:MAG: hypothetical protein JSR80_08185 [Verrucomicrobia bacterium]|nr:hypothetical protein [Verrucomicrobiota bacterium]